MACMSDFIFHNEDYILAAVCHPQFRWIDDPAEKAQYTHMLVSVGYVS